MTAATPTALQPLHDAMYIALDLLTPSPTNPRKRFSEASLTEMAESIMPHGVMQPIVVRPNPAHVEGDGRPPYEIVSGERRWRGCKRLTAAGIDYPHAGQVPALLRQLGDGEVLALQLLENIQRDDLHPLEEAEHYHLMTTHPSEAITVEELCHRIGKKPSYVYNRLTLRKLAPAAREAFLEGTLDYSKALRVAAMPAEDQPKIVKHITTWSGEPMGVRAAQRFILDEFSLLLAKAPFDTTDAALVPAAGACTACPKRRSVAPQLFEDAIADGDRCLHGACWRVKLDAHDTALLQDARARGFLVPEQRAGEVFSARTSTLMPGWISIEANVPPHLGDSRHLVKEALDAGGVDESGITAVVDHSTHALVLAVPELTLEVALRAAGWHDSQQPRAATPPSAKAPAPQADFLTPPSPPPAPAPKKAKAPAAPAAPAYDPLDDVLAAPVLPVSVKRVDAALQATLARQARASLTAGLVAHKAAAEMRDRGAAMGMLLPHGMAQLLAYFVLSMVDELPLPKLSKLTGVDVRSETTPLGLSREDASCLVVALLALMDEREPQLPDRSWAAAVGPLVGVSFAAVEERADAVVNERLRIELLARAPGPAAAGKGGGGKGKKPAAKAAAKKGAVPAKKAAPAKKAPAAAAAGGAGDKKASAGSAGERSKAAAPSAARSTSGKAKSQAASPRSGKAAGKPAAVLSDAAAWPFPRNAV